MKEDTCCVWSCNNTEGLENVTVEATDCREEIVLVTLKACPECKKKYFED